MAESCVGLRLIRDGVCCLWFALVAFLNYLQLVHVDLEVLLFVLHDY